MTSRIITEHFLYIESPMPGGVSPQVEETITPEDSRAELFFPNGFVGFSEARYFELKGVKNVIHIKGIDHPELGFYALPLDATRSVFEKEDIQQACEQLHIPLESLALLALLSSRREAGEMIIAANLRAPIFIDAFKKHAWQYVFAHNKYAIRHEIGRL